MANTIKIKNSSTANAVPSTLEYGEIAINYTDGKIFYKNNANTIVSLASSIRIDDLLDVVTTAPVAGQILSYDGTNWVNVENFSEATKHIVKNDSGVTLAAGSAVYTSGSNGTNILVKQAQANTEVTSATVIGLLANSLVSNATGYVVTQGLVSGLNTSSALAGDPVWLSPTTPGGITFGLANKPSAPNHLVYMGVVTRSHAVNGEIFVHILNGWELEELHNVSISNTLATNDVLKYDGTKWANDSTINQRISDLYVLAYMEIP